MDLPDVEYLQCNSIERASKICMVSLKIHIVHFDKNINGEPCVYIRVLDNNLNIYMCIVYTCYILYVEWNIELNVTRALLGVLSWYPTFKSRCGTYFKIGHLLMKSMVTRSSNELHYSRTIVPVANVLLNVPDFE